VTNGTPRIILGDHRFRGGFCCHTIFRRVVREEIFIKWVPQGPSLLTEGSLLGKSKSAASRWIGGQEKVMMGNERCDSIGAVRSSFKASQSRKGVVHACQEGTSPRHPTRGKNSNFGVRGIGEGMNKLLMQRPEKVRLGSTS